MLNKFIAPLIIRVKIKTREGIGVQSQFHNYIYCIAPFGE